MLPQVLREYPIGGSQSSGGVSSLSVRSFWNNRSMMDAGNDRCIYVFNVTHAALMPLGHLRCGPTCALELCCRKQQGIAEAAEAAAAGKASTAGLQWESRVGLALGDGKLEFYVTIIWCGLLLTMEASEAL